ncbi:MAG: type II toxin-antitoxin system Phd/YefM family antitoxin [Terriglobales bacterium]
MAKTIAAAAFKAHCLAIMDEVQRTRVPVVITKRGRPVAQLTPLPSSEAGIFGRLRGQIEILGDIESPAIPPAAWTKLR